MKEDARAGSGDMPGLRQAHQERGAELLRRFGGTKVPETDRADDVAYIVQLVHIWEPAA